MRSFRCSLPRILFLLIIGAVSAYDTARPEISWDGLGYIASAESGKSPAEIHRIAYNALPHTVGDEIASGRPFRSAVEANPYYLCEQIPFYSVKPLYVALLKALHSAGLDYAAALSVLSTVPYFLLGLLLWKWGSKYLTPWRNLITCGAILLSPVVLFIGTDTTPDSLSLLVGCVGLYFILERQFYVLGCGVLATAVWIRTDMLLLAVIVSALLLYRRRLEWREAAALVMIAVLSVFTINHFAGNYGYRVLLYNSFGHTIVNPGEAVVSFTPRMYFTFVSRYAINALFRNTFFGVFAVIAVMIFSVEKNRKLYSDIALATVAYRLAYFVLFPSMEIRYAPFLYVIPFLLLAISISEGGNAKRGSVDGTAVADLAEAR